MRGEGLSDAVCDVDPHMPDQPVRKCIPLDNSSEANFTSSVINKFIKRSYEILKEQKENIIREENGKFPANSILLRGAGQFRKIPSFKERYDFDACCIAGGGLYKGVASLLGMDIIDVEGATALPDSNVYNKFKRAIEMVNDKYTFVFVHVKATDSLGEDGNYLGKKEFIEKIDAAFGEFFKKDEDTLLVATADHSTPCHFKAHSADPVPVMFHGKGVRVDDVSAFDERSCTRGGLGIIEGKDLLPRIQNLFGKLHLYGA
jgi:2,3-bisphosphoglycerate-independent phosphoglycerate mutase